MCCTIVSFLFFTVFNIILPFSVTKCFHDSINKNAKFYKYLRIVGVHELAKLNDIGSFIVIFF